MAFPVAPGTVDLSSTGSIQYIPEIWAPKFAVRFYPTTFMSQITNKDFEGTLSKMGDKVIIRTKPTVSGFRYVKNMDISTQNSVGYGAPVTMTIERGWGWRVPVNKVDQKQADVDYLGAIMEEGALDSKVHIETEFLAEFYTEAASYNHGNTAGKKSGGYVLGATNTPVAIDQTNALTYLMMLQAVATEARMPTEGRWLVLPPWYAYLLGISDLKNASFTGMGSSTILSGKIPDRMAGFQLFVTDLYTAITDGAHSCVPLMFGHPSCATFAAQLALMETVPTIKDYGTTVQALTIYDWACINPDGIGYGYVYKA